MIKVIPLEVEHMHEVLTDQPMVREHINDAQIAGLVASKHSYAAVNAYGKVIACAGLVEKWSNRAEAWAIIDQHSPQYFLSLHLAVKRFLKNVPIRRIEAEVNLDFINGHRWVQLLGFKLEAPVMEAFDPNGNSCSLYAFVKET